MSFNLDNNPNKLMEEINNLNDEKFEKEKEYTSSMMKVDNVFNLSTEAIVEAHPFLSLANAKELKLFQEELDEVIKKLGPSDPIEKWISVYHYKQDYGLTFCVTITFKNTTDQEEITVRKAIFIEESPTESHLNDCLELFLPNLLNQLRSVRILTFQKVELDQYMADFVLKHQEKADKVFFYNRGTCKSLIRLASLDFFQFCEKIKNLSILEDTYPAYFLNDQNMIKIIKANRLSLTRDYDCVSIMPTFPRALTDKTLKALEDGSTIKLNFDVSHCRNDFPVTQIEKLIQRCVENKVANLNWELGILRSEQNSAAILLMITINGNFYHPYRVTKMEYCTCFGDCYHNEPYMFTVGKRDSSAKDDEFRIRFLVPNK